MGFADAVPYITDQESGRAAEHEHRPPAQPGAEGGVGYGGEEDAEIVASVHPTRASLTAGFRPRLGDQDASQGPFAADAKSGEQAESPKLPHAGGQGAEKGEQRVTKDSQSKRADAPEAIADRTPQKGQAPSDQEDRKQQTSMETDVSRSACNSRARQ
jgi:hypothetical protein